MKVLATALCYNERPYIEEMVNFFKEQGCSLFILDNMSNDGTYEWLIKNNIPTARIDTKESFHLEILQKELNKHLSLINPDWIVYTGVDGYYHFPSTIKEEIILADSLGHNIIQTFHYSVYNTGEERKLPLNSTYFYSSKDRDLQMIAKYQKGKTEIVADAIKVVNPNVYISTGYFVNYGMCKSKKEREITYARRIKAWEKGLIKGWGTHYKPAQLKNWKWNSNKLIDIRETPEYDKNVKWCQPSKKVTIIIPTMYFHNSEMEIMLDRYEDCPYIEKVLIINNTNDTFVYFKHSKVFTFNVGHNIFVNPAWKIGVLLANTKKIALVNDDIIIKGDLNKVFEQVFDISLKNTVIGPSVSCYKNKGLYEGDIIIEKTISPKMNYGFGVFMFMEKDTFLSIKIPKELKVWYGDMLFFRKLTTYNFKGVEIITEFGGTSRKINLDEFPQKEKEIYKHEIKL